MGAIDSFFFDTYAFYEILHGNESYASYGKNVSLVTTRLNLMELHYGLILAQGKEAADRWYHYFLPYAIEITDDVIKMANVFRAAHKQARMSYVDCIGYIIAKTNGIKFLTGDKQFKDLENVEYVQ